MCFHFGMGYILEFIQKRGLDVRDNRVYFTFFDDSGNGRLIY